MEELYRERHDGRDRMKENGKLGEKEKGETRLKRDGLR